MIRRTPRIGSHDEFAGMLFLAFMTEGGASAEGQDAFERLVRDHYGGLLGFFSHRGCTPEECEDLTQDTFLRAYRSFDGFRGDAKLSTWLITIATNVWRNRVRDAETAKRDAAVVPLPEEGPAADRSRHDPALRSPDKLPPDEAIHVERRRLLRSVMDELPDEMRRSVLLRVYQGMSYRDVADTLGVSVATVKSQVSRAQPRLKSALAEHYPELESQLDERRS